jgi:hypothetical protein
MDGGGTDVNEKGELQTVWRREGNIFAARPGEPEQKLGEGKNCALASVKNLNVYSWSENGMIVKRKPCGEKKMLGNGTSPVLKIPDKSHAICEWAAENNIKASKIKL